MKAKWWYVRGPRRDLYESEADYVFACYEADDRLRILLQQTFAIAYPTRRPPAPIVRCKAPAPECVRLGYAVQGALGSICTRLIEDKRHVPRGVAALKDGEAWACQNQSAPMPPPKGRARPAYGPREPRPRGDGVIASWLRRTVAKAATSADERVARQARAYLAGDVPEDDDELIRFIRLRARSEGRPRP